MFRADDEDEELGNIGDRRWRREWVMVRVGERVTQDVVVEIGFRVKL